MHKNTFLSLLMLILLIVSAASGCGDGKEPTYPVYGIVRFPDGKVLRQGTVEFESLDREEPITAYGDIQPDGAFALGTFEESDGAFEGKHRAVVISDYNIGSGAERPGLIPEQKLHPKFRSYRTADLEFTVKPEENNFVVEVDYAPKDQDEDQPEGGSSE